ncbi:class I adenylate-forming enzyme family protein [Streptomyces pinistramenti]|uniref:class I adenylate-forming enzyme family protein n=1 Tax=Streptomyces pinistramenti TaxID=2884812 RepID=UPI001D07C2BF|nr:AMP-binding protein [Streptomyces pinistramenti]MCB5911255.1 AMP-binding protein [Streptomyces pinistramenti]
MFESARIQTLWELVEYRAGASPGAPMFFDGDGRTATFGEVRDEALRAAAGFQELGIGAGTRVAWQLPTRIGTVIASIALARLGAVQTPVIHLHREREVGFVLAESAAEFVLVPGVWRGFDFTAMARKLAGDGVRVITVGAEGPADGGYGLPGGDPRALAEAPRPYGTADTRWISYTSGTTSSPKGVEHTDASLIAGGVGLATALGMSADDVGSIAFPYAHIAGPDYVIAMLVSGFPAVIIDVFRPGDAAAVYRRHGVTMAGGSTAFYQAFLDESRRHRHELPHAGRLIPSLRLLSGGGAPLPPELYAEVRRELDCALVHGYGMTECPMIAMGTPYDRDEQLAHTVGRPVAGARVRIARPDGSEAAAGEGGEVTVKGPMVFRRYTDPALTAAAFDADGYFRTGDLGHLRPDGHLVLTGRSKDIIIRKGENISAQEVEDLLLAHPAVAEAAVIGLPDRARGERVCAVVTLAEPAAPPPTLAELTAHLRAAGLMAQKLPEQLEITAGLPRGGPLGKVLKTALRERYAAGQGAPDAAGPA